MTPEFDFVYSADEIKWSAEFDNPAGARDALYRAKMYISIAINLGCVNERPSGDSD